ncbi:MAG TPA: AMP-binding protein [Catalimonadaceae bacterium]|nr:AMP-binding protein [Catalimonadaceae bacterium]
MRLWIEGSPYDPASFAELEKRAENLEHLVPVLSFLRFWFSDLEEWTTHTSGSTSDPKPIRISRQQLESSARLHLDYFKPDPEHVGLVLCISARHVGGFMILVRAMLGNLDVLILPPSSNPIPAEGLPSFRKWFISMVPMQFYQLLELENLPVVSQNWAGILLGGAAVSDQINKAISSLDCPVFHSYGMTETVSHIAVRQIHPSENEHFTDIAFDLLPGIDIRLNDNSCLAIRGPVTDQEWIQTNDVAVLISPTRFLLLGRSDHIINSGGLKIQPDSVASLVLSLIPETNPDFDVLGMPDHLLGQRVVVVFYSDDSETFRQFWEKSDWENQIMKVTDPAKRRILPKAVFTLPSRPMTASQKTDFPAIRSALVAANPFWEKPEKPGP